MGSDTKAFGAFTQAAGAVGLRARVLEQVRSAGLEGNVAELDALGYTVVEDAAPLDLFDRVGAAIVDITGEVRARGEEPFNFGPNTSMVYRLLSKSDAVAEAAITA